MKRILIFLVCIPASILTNDDEKSIPMPPSMVDFYKQEISRLNSQMKRVDKDSDWQAFVNKYENENPEIKKNRQQFFFRLQTFSAISHISSFIVTIDPTNDKSTREETIRLQRIQKKVDECEFFLLENEYTLKQKFLDFAGRK